MSDHHGSTEPGPARLEARLDEIDALGGVPAVTRPTKTGRSVASTFVFQGERYSRTTLKGANLLGALVFGPLHDVVGDPDGDALLMPGVHAYSEAQYEVARGWLVRCIDAHPETAEELSTQLAFCEHVLAVPLDQRDLEYLTEQNSRRLLRRWLRRGQHAEHVRCKWCGHYTPYLDPWAGNGYTGENSCQRCGWSFPAPDFVWDSLDGLAYSYYRGSMRGGEFYDWFEANFGVENKTRSRQA